MSDREALTLQVTEFDPEEEFPDRQSGVGGGEADVADRNHSDDEQDLSNAAREHYVDVG